MQSHRLYNGEVELLFDETPHKYYIGDRRIDNVTDITKVINKPFLLPWSLGQGAMAAKKLLRVGDFITENLVKEVGKAIREASNIKREDAASIGSEVHKWADQWIRSKIGFCDEPEFGLHLSEPVRNGITAFLANEEERRPEHIECERKVYSRIHDYTGTLDHIDREGDKLVVVDMKTSKKPEKAKFPYEEWWLQEALYQIAYEEETGETISDKIILHLDKTTGEFHPYRRGEENNESDKQAALALRQLHRWLNQ